MEWGDCGSNGRTYVGRDEYSNLKPHVLDGASSTLAPAVGNITRKYAKVSLDIPKIGALCLMCWILPHAGGPDTPAGIPFLGAQTKAILRILLRQITNLNPTTRNVI